MPGKLQSFHVTCECETLQLIPVVLCNLKQEILVWNNGVPQGFILGPTLSLHSWRRVLTPLFYKDLPPYIAYSSFFKFCPTPPPPPLPCRLQPQPPLLFLLSYFFDWMGDHATFGVLFYLMILWIYQSVSGRNECMCGSSQELCCRCV